MFENVSYEEVKHLSKILAKWIKLNTSIYDFNVNEKRLYWESLFIIETHNQWEAINKKFPDCAKKKIQIDIIPLLYANSFYEKTNYLLKVPKKRFSIFSDLFKILLDSISNIRTTFNVLKIIFKKKEIILNKDLSDFLKKKNYYLIGDILFSSLIVFIYKRTARRKFNNFLKKEKLNYNLETLTKIIPSYLIELLPLYSFLSKYIQVDIVRAWIMDIYFCPVLLIKCILDKNIEIIGYQHGGNYGFDDIFVQRFEYSFYDQFIFWGFRKNDSPPFKFKNSYILSEDKINSIKFDKFEFDKIFIILDRLDSPSQESKPESVLNKLSDLSVFLIKEKIKTHLLLHPFDYEYWIFKMKETLKDVILSKGAADYIDNNSGIFIVSIYSTLFWKIISEKKYFLCFYNSENIPSNYQNKYILDILKSVDLFFKIEDMQYPLKLKNIHTIKENNKKFYKKIESI